MLYDNVQIIDMAVCTLHSANALGMNPTIFPSSMGK